MTSGEIFLDTTRLISRSWTGRQSTGIDRVCHAYWRHFHDKARAVVQHRGVVKVFSKHDSNKLFGMLEASVATFRSKMSYFAPLVITRSPSTIDGDGAFYINTSHTDFDLDAHHEWVAASNLRPIYFLHDLIPVTHPELSRPKAVERHRGRVLGALQNGAGIVVNTQATAQQIEKFAAEKGVAVPPLIVAPLAGAPLDSNTAGKKAKKRSRRRTAAKGGRYFVCVGTIERRKNYHMLFKVWERLADRLGEQCPQLIIIGQTGPDSAPVIRDYKSRSQIQSRVEFVTNASDEKMGAIVAKAEALLMPTIMEGFGLPVIEALQIGTPVVASDIPSFREIGQGIPVLLDPAAPQDWEETVIDFLTSPAQRQRQADLMSGFAPPSWGVHFAKLDQWLDSLSCEAGSLQESVQVPCLNV